ncbi:unnamed protein product [Prorocentrum cordatum]|uniref:RanBP2-type domain-containing protein n=1 Tax=Prorocentrum cordatum TaxID=2364126 RepID=A0ABN9PUC4_9DINO|nr:unnamed protein product [Polarella glacialis]
MGQRMDRQAGKHLLHDGPQPGVLLGRHARGQHTEALLSLMQPEERASRSMMTVDLGVVLMRVPKADAPKPGDGPFGASAAVRARLKFVDSVGRKVSDTVLQDAFFEEGEDSAGLLAVPLSFNQRVPAGSTGDLPFSGSLLAMHHSAMAGQHGGKGGQRGGMGGQAAHWPAPSPPPPPQCWWCPQYHGANSMLDRLCRMCYPWRRRAACSPDVAFEETEADIRLQETYHTYLDLQKVKQQRDDEVSRAQLLLAQLEQMFPAPMEQWRPSRSCSRGRVITAQQFAGLATVLGGLQTALSKMHGDQAARRKCRRQRVAEARRAAGGVPEPAGAPAVAAAAEAPGGAVCHAREAEGDTASLVDGGGGGGETETLPAEPSAAPLAAHAACGAAAAAFAEATDSQPSASVELRRMLEPVGQRPVASV